MAGARVPNSIVCLLSALRVHGIGSQAPAHVWLGIPHKARPPRLRRLQLRIVRLSGPAWTYGVKDVEFEGVPARITGPARTVADCFRLDRKSTRLNSSHSQISYAVFCLKKKKIYKHSDSTEST